jgi:hypothetical protein
LSCPERSPHGATPIPSAAAIALIIFVAVEVALVASREAAVRIELKPRSALGVAAAVAALGWNAWAP